MAINVGLVGKAGCKKIEVELFDVNTEKSLNLHMVDQGLAAKNLPNNKIKGNIKLRKNLIRKSKIRKSKKENKILDDEKSTDFPKSKIDDRVPSHEKNIDYKNNDYKISDDEELKQKIDNKIQDNVLQLNLQLINSSNITGAEESYRVSQKKWKKKNNNTIRDWRRFGGEIISDKTIPLHPDGYKTQDSSQRLPLTPANKPNEEVNEVDNIHYYEINDPSLNANGSIEWMRFGGEIISDKTIPLHPDGYKTQDSSQSLPHTPANEPNEEVNEVDNIHYYEINDPSHNANDSIEFPSKQGKGKNIVGIVENGNPPLVDCCEGICDGKEIDLTMSEEEKLNTQHSEVNLVVDFEDIHDMVNLCLGNDDKFHGINKKVTDSLSCYPPPNNVSSTNVPPTKQSEQSQLTCNVLQETESYDLVKIDLNKRISLEEAETLQERWNHEKDGLAEVKDKLKSLTEMSTDDLVSYYLKRKREKLNLMKKIKQEKKNSRGLDSEYDTIFEETNDLLLLI